VDIWQSTVKEELVKLFAKSSPPDEWHAPCRHGVFLLSLTRTNMFCFAFLWENHPKTWSHNLALDPISWKILLKTCRLKCLIRHDTIWWWAELSDSHQFPHNLNTDPLVKQLTHYIGLYDFNRKWYKPSFVNFWWEYKIWKNNLESAWPPMDLAKQGTEYNDRPPLARAIACNSSSVWMSNKLAYR